jgi:hypothetical protein
VSPSSPSQKLKPIPISHTQPATPTDNSTPQQP